jgi:hypothetical protein
LEITGSVAEVDGNTQIIYATFADFVDFWSATPEAMKIPTAPHPAICIKFTALPIKMAIPTSSTGGVGELSRKILTIWPNPVSDRPHLRFESRANGDASVIVSIYNIRGRMVREFAISSAIDG